MHYDVAIVGGGLVGAGLAAALGRSDCQIALIDAKLPSNNDHRLFALNASSCQFLQNLNLWPLLSEKSSAIHQVHASRQGRFGAVRLTNEDVGVAALGHVVPACEVETALNAEVAALPEKNCKIYRPAKLLSLTQDSDRVALCLESQDEKIHLTATLVIGADGTESTVRKELGIATEDFDYQQTAIVFKTTLQRSHQHIAYERFIANGAIAMLPLPNNQCASVCTIDNDKLDEWLSLSDELFLQKLQQTFGYRLGKLQAVSSRFTYPLRMRRAKSAVAGRVMLIGNAAHTLHPVASQGFNLAMYEAAAIADAIAAHQPNLTSINLDDVYQQTRQQQAMSTRVSSNLPRLLATKSAWQSIAIQLGMIGMDMCQPVKKYFIQGMMGRVGALPSLLLNAKEL